MTTSRSLADGFATTLSNNDLDALAGLIHDDYINHNRYAEPGKAGAIAVFAHFLDAFDDFRVEVDDVLVDGDTVVGRYTYRGRHTGRFMGVPASGNEIEMHSIDIWRVSDGRLAEHWDELNTLELFQQIGAIPQLP